MKIFILLNTLAIVVLGFFYLVAYAFPSTFMGSVARWYGMSRILSKGVAHSIATISAVFFLLVLSIGKVNVTRFSVILKPLRIVITLTLLWCPNEFKEHQLNAACHGFDGTIYLEVAGLDIFEMSWAQFPKSMGGAKWQLFQSPPRVYEFAPPGHDSEVTFEFANGTYIHHSSMTEEARLTGPDEPLSFAKFGLQSQGVWVRKCYHPTVLLRTSSGDVIVKSGGNGNTDIARMEVCAMRTMGMEAVVVAIGRILIALEQEVNRCCLYYNELGKCITLEDY
jgi:hypothetical protein